MTKAENARGTALAKGLQSVASIALVVMMMVVVADVTLRFFLNTPVPGAYDAVSIALLVMVFFGIGPVIASRVEIMIDIIDNVVPGSLRRGLALVAAAGTLLTFLFIGWSMIEPAVNAYRYGDRLLELGLPSWILWGVAFAGLLGIIVCALTVLWRALRGQAGETSNHDEGAL